MIKITKALIRLSRVETKLVETDGIFWGFKVKDIISSKNPNSLWFNQRIEVMGFIEVHYKHRQCLFGKEENAIYCNFATSKKGLTLIE